MELVGYNFIDTSTMIDPRQPRSLKECLARFLNGEIQSDGTTHSSIIDARSALALFLHFFQQYQSHPVSNEMGPSSTSMKDFVENFIEPFTEEDLRISMVHAKKKKIKADRRKEFQLKTYGRVLHPSDEEEGLDEDKENIKPCFPNSKPFSEEGDEIPKKITKEQIIASKLVDDQVYLVNMKELEEAIEESVTKALRALLKL